MFCSTCGHEIEKGSAFCGNCGHAVEQTQAPGVNPAVVIKKIPFRLIGYGIAAILVVLALVYSCNPDNNILGIESMREAYTDAKEVVTDHLLVPSTAEFPKFESEYVTRQRGEYTYDGIPCSVYTVTAYVEAQNVFGVATRSDFSVDIIFLEGREKGEYYYENLYIE